MSQPNPPDMVTYAVIIVVFQFTNNLLLERLAIVSTLIEDRSKTVETLQRLE